MNASHFKAAGTLLITALFVLAVSGTLNAQESYKVDYSSELRCDLSEVPQITDSPSPIFVALNEYKDAKAAIIVYGLEGAALTFASNIKKWMSEVRGISPERLVPLYGGKSETLRLELWLIPKGALPPTVTAADDNEHAVLFDTYDYWDGESCGPDRPPALILFGKTLKERPALKGVIVIRPHRNGPGVRAGNEYWDPDGYSSHLKAVGRASRDRRFLINKLGISPSRIKAIVGSDGKWSHTEIWLVPPGASPPSPRIKKSIKGR